MNKSALRRTFLPNTRLRSISREDSVQRLSRCPALVFVGCGATASNDPGSLPSSNDPFCTSLPPGAKPVASEHFNTRKGAEKDGTSRV